MDENISCGILNNELCRNLFEKINKRPYCEECRGIRNEFRLKDMKNGYYSNFIPGFSSRTLKIPLDVLIVAEAHGGGRPETFREQKNLDNEIDDLAKYYLSEHLKKFHQKEMRALLVELTSRGKSWIFTDLIKCFVWQGKDNELKGKENKKEAIKRCSCYLDEQISILKPRKILCLGNTVAKEYFRLKKPMHGKEYPVNGNIIVHSTFPSRNTADIWVKNEGWKQILQKL